MLKKFAFDLDGIFINSPPCMSHSLIEWLYRDQTKKKLTYRFPGIFEQQIRKLSHLPFVRPPITKNCNLLRNLVKTNKYQFFLISGRFSFLEGLTYAWLRKYNLEQVFTKIYLNTDNLQPHQFKEKLLKEISLDGYFEDDPDSCFYLASHLPNLHFYFYSETNQYKINLKNVTKITDLGRVLKIM